MKILLCSSFCAADPGQTDNIGVCSAKGFRACSRNCTVFIVLCFAGIRDEIADENNEVYGNGQNTDMLPPLIFKDKKRILFEKQCYKAQHEWFILPTRVVFRGLIQKIRIKRHAWTSMKMQCIVTQFVECECPNTPFPNIAQTTIWSINDNVPSQLPVEQFDVAFIWSTKEISWLVSATNNPCSTETPSALLVLTFASGCWGLWMSSNNSPSVESVDCSK